MPSAVSVWIHATRPKTLPAAVAPVVMGIAIAVRDGAQHVLAAAAALAGALLIQIGTNFANDYYDGVKGTDTEDRLGPQRAVQAGLVSPRAMRLAFLLTFGLAVLVGAYLVSRGGLPILAIGVASVVCGVLYTGGPRPLGYLGLGDLLVLGFFGPVATAGTYYVQSGIWSEVALIAGLAPGLLAVGLLTVNNLRDVEGDRKAGKHTLAVRFGPNFAKAEFATCLLGAAAVPVVLWTRFGGPPGVLAASAACLLAVPAWFEVRRWSPGARLGKALAGMGLALTVYALAFCVGWSL